MRRAAAKHLLTGTIINHLFALIAFSSLLLVVCSIHSFRLDFSRQIAVPDVVTSSSVTASGLSTSAATGTGSAEKFVTQCYVRLYGNFRAGNHLFALAAMMYVAEKTNRTVIMKPRGWCLDEMFDMSWLQRFNVTTEHKVKSEDYYGPLGPCGIVFSKYNYNGEERRMLDITAAGNAIRGKEWKSAGWNGETLEKIRNWEMRTVLMCGGHQTYFYPDQLGPTLRRRLKFHQHVQHAAWRTLNSSRPADWSPGSYFRVGVHLRRGDFLDSDMIRYGLTVASVQYINNSMRYFISRHRRVQFLVASNDLEWPRRHLPKLLSSGEVFWKNASGFENLRVNSSVVVTLSTSSSAGVDMALLASCDANIVSTGSFSWWTAWLANKTTIYYDRYPLKRTTFAKHFSRSSYYPKRWIPMT